MKFTPDENDIIYDTYGIDIVSIIRAIYEKLLGQDFDALVDTLSRIWDIYSIIAILLSLLFLFGFVYAKSRLLQLRGIQNQQFVDEEQAWAAAYGSGARQNSRWEDVKTHISSDNPNDWRQAIVEADIILEEVVNKAGYVGATLGEKLKSADSSTFKTIQDAWEAHKVRNQIAHEGVDFVLTKKIAQETITRFERVFREFGAV